MIPRAPKTGGVPGPRPAVLRAALLAPLLLACASGQRGAGFEQLQTTAVDATGASVLGLLTSGRGNLVVIGQETDSLHVNYAVSTPSRDGLFRNQVETIDKEDSLFVTIRPATNATIDLQVQTPERLRLLLTDEGRDVIVRNIENRVDVARRGGGLLDLEDIEGPLTIDDGTGAIRIRDVRGPIVIDDAGGDIAIHDVKNSVRIDTQSGDLTIEQAGADVTVTAGPGDLTIRDVSGKVAYRKIGTGRVTVERVAGGVERL